MNIYITISLTVSVKSSKITIKTHEDKHEMSMLGQSCVNENTTSKIQ